MPAPALTPASGFGRLAAVICRSSRPSETIGRTPVRPTNGHLRGPSIPCVASIAIPVAMLSSGSPASPRPLHPCFSYPDRRCIERRTG